mmetsp:Transcript_35444/g.35105  ORF Transcript_35444/g.35105 Transcript_35444/m.35105 type:complete len:248 (-) Transcript_35444:73-816(-)|eukprot:CAMPEP_0196995152 /NCGR_PEP_ID=MMETSP1380-20130617/1332_1 /TAXON_ID=5936 /ORGANISM="Euplotes crassus, Strain CT5" /LENGTH=247 /DNA_ID=CAMNT_0042410753 /DNA_START=142 /DNA_END=885 /DNA_ORIENTATION=+
MNQGYSPLCKQQEMKYAYDRNQSQSPVINLMQCPSSPDVGVSNPSDRKDCSNTPALKLRHKLSSRSKAFIKKTINNKNDRKASSDTKAHTEDEGNNSDDSENDIMATTPNLFLKKCMTTQFPHSPNNDNLVLSEKAQTSFVTKFKTELCKNWQAGDCKFGSKCSFAHGVEELSQRKNLPSNYKTKICKQFHEEFYCSYGERCQFIHLSKPSEEKEMTLTKAIYSSVGLKPAHKEAKGRLSVFKNFAN